ncbi:uncharacterized protein LOC123517417 [Portunus trituberculatus]|uniref:uncharacterized protein LOC123517417 n=1 Tax=Portunus trituberculatus TaxID=210409 RepID=UPI001E1CD207|nr:uncharacterized protein LOC123517417 [Portunus trituberculatus]
MLLMETPLPPSAGGGGGGGGGVEGLEGGEDGEKWVQAVEHVCQLIPRDLPPLVARNGFDACGTLCDWVEVGLDFQRALAQEQPVYKIRHMKVGVRLTQLLLQCCCG